MDIRQIIWEHYQNPKHRIIDAKKIKIENGTGCQDYVEIILKINNNKITEAKFLAEGCILVNAAADILCEWLINKEYKDFTKLKNEFLTMLQNQKYSIAKLKPFDIFVNLQKQITRQDCVWKVFLAAEKELIGKNNE